MQRAPEESRPSPGQRLRTQEGRWRQTHRAASRDVTDGYQPSRAGKVQRQTQHQRQSAEGGGKKNSTVSVSSECKSPPSLLASPARRFGSSRRRHASLDATAQIVIRMTMWCNPKLSCAWSPESIFTPDLSILVRQPSDSHSSDYSRLIQMFLVGGMAGGSSRKISLDLWWGF